MQTSEIVKPQATSNKKVKYSYNRSWEVVFNDCHLKLEKILQSLCSSKYGVLKGFAVRHKKENGDAHVHCGIILRDKPKIKATAQDIKSYFTVKGTAPPQVHVALKKKGKEFDPKLQQYWNYCNDQLKHPTEDISEHFCHKWQPKDTAIGELKPAEYMTLKVRQGMTVEQLEDFIDDPETELEHYKEALRNFDIYEKMIIKHDEIRARKVRRQQYKEDVKLYRPFQKALTDILDNQNDRNIHNQFDKGKTGKNWWLEKENKRTDTLILANVSTKSIAEAWNPRIHKRIIFDIPRGGAAYLNYRAVESLKNGQIFAEKYKSKPKCSTFKPSIVILTNEPIAEFVNWTEDRLTESTTSEANGYELEM